MTKFSIVLLGTHCVFQAEQDLQKLTVDANRSRQTLEEQMVEFERKKMEDIRVRTE